MKIKYILGIVLMEMQMHQAAAFQFVDVVRSGNATQVRKSLEKLSQAADYLNDDSMLRYAIGKVQVGQFPKSQRDMVYYRLGQFWMQKKNFSSAADYFGRVSTASPFFASAKYDQGLSFSELNQTDKAIGAFNELIFARRQKSVTDRARVAAVIGKARAYYQQKDWDRAIEAYREVPRDTELWHDALFESSWAMLRAARFRSALSNFQSLHSDYYNDFYMPESLLLRGMVYLYICQYDEMEKVISLFKGVYAPIYNRLVRYLKSHSDPVVYFRELAAMSNEYDLLANNNEARKKYGIPFLVARKVLREGDFRRIYRYYQKLALELKRMESMPDSWRKSSLATVAVKIVKTRMANSEKAMGRITRTHMRWVVADLRDLNEQNEFLTFEMLNGKKETIKKNIAGKGIVNKKSIDSDADREFYVQNGYEYWPFQGEYWLDEIGNYHYLGVQSCE
jgi:tetratricopeptide (TPR) repeat protein